MPPTADPTPLTLYPCPVCHGVGFLDQRPCAECRGRALVARQGQRLLAWNLPVDQPHLAQRHLVAIAEYATVSLFSAVAALGALSLLWQLTRLTASSASLWRFWERPSLPMLMVWLSLLADTYLVYHFSLAPTKIHRLPRQAPTPRQATPAPRGWDAALAGPKNFQYNLEDFYTPNAIHAVERSWESAQRLGHHVVAPLHLLVVLLESKTTVAMFVRLGVSFQAFKRLVQNILPRYASPTGQPLLFTADFYQLLFAAYAEADRQRQPQVDVTDLLIASLRVSPLVRDLLFDLGVDEDKIRNVVSWFLVQRRDRARLHQVRRRSLSRPKRTLIDRAMTGVATPWLDHFSQDLTHLARVGWLAPCVNRQPEIERIISILAGDSRHHALLVGNPGTGKRTIVNGLAQRMVAEDVPRFLQDKRLVSLSVARLVSGVNVTVAEERLLRCLGEAGRSGNVLLCIHDVSTMVGVAVGASGSLDLAGALSQGLTQTGVRLIATALPADYTRYLESHALGQILERIEVEEPTGNDAIQILEAQAGLIEARDHVWFTYDAIANAVRLSGRYLHDRFLPAKAIEVLEATAIAVANQKGRDAAVSGADVSAEISRKTQIPLSEVTQAESRTLLNLESEIHRRVVDQAEAVHLVSAAIRRARAELRDQKRPIVSLLFLGPTGVGKTELAKTVAAVYFGRGSQLIRLDMSEYQEQSSINRMLGAPPGYDGSSQGGYLTEAVRRHPFSLVLLDEMEKAHPDILNVFLQVIDDGRLTDALGRTIDFTNVILIATSNACTSSIHRLASAGQNVEQIKENIMAGELQQSYRPELLNRFDGIVVFKPLGMAEVIAITRLLLDEVADRLREKGIGMSSTAGAVVELAAAGFDPAFGARPLRRVIQERVDDVITVKILQGEVGRRDTVILDVGSRITIKKPAPG